MKRTLAVALLAIVTMLPSAVPPAAAAHERGDLTVGMNGAREVGTKGDRNASGKIHIDFFDAIDNPAVVFPGEHYLCYELRTRKLDSDMVGLHIHVVSGHKKNPRKDNGPVAIDLLGDTRTSGNATCVAVDEDVFDAIAANPSDYYVNLHTSTHPAGAIRGQLHSFS